VLCLNARPEPLDYAAQKNFLKGAFPRFAQQAVEVFSFLLMGGLMAAAKEFARRLPFVVQVSADLGTDLFSGD
jgi:hypothetical protein